MSASQCRTNAGPVQAEGPENVDSVGNAGHLNQSQTLLGRLKKAGLAVELMDDDRIKLSPTALITDEVRQLVKSNKAEIVHELQTAMNDSFDAEQPELAKRGACSDCQHFEPIHQHGEGPGHCGVHANSSVVAWSETVSDCEQFEAAQYQHFVVTDATGKQFDAVTGERMTAEQYRQLWPQFVDAIGVRLSDDGD